METEDLACGSQTDLVCYIWYALALVLCATYSV